jgi:hypothetical protein
VTISHFHLFLCSSLYLPTIVCISHFPWFSDFSPYSRSYSFTFLIFHVLERFLPYSRSLPCFSLIFHVFSFFAMIRSYIVHFYYSNYFCVSLYITGHYVFVSPFPRISVFLSYSRSYCEHFSFSPFSVFLAIFHNLQCVFLILDVFQFSQHTPSPTMCISHFSRCSVISSFFKSTSGFFSFSMIFSFLTLFHVLQWTFL